MAESYELQTCPKCKKRIMLAAKACVHCGWSSVQTAPNPNPVTTLAIPLPTPSQPDPEIIDADYSVGPPDYCPNCGYEGVRKVSSVHGEQTNSSDSTNLARNLNPPPYPQTPNSINGNIDAGCAGYGYGCGSAILISLLGAGMFSNDKSGASAAIVLPIAAAIGFFLGKHLRDSGREKAQADLNIKTEHRTPDMNVFESKYAVWDRLYYCSKCDRAIDPITSKTAAPYAWQLLI